MPLEEPVTIAIFMSNAVAGLAAVGGAAERNAVPAKLLPVATKAVLWLASANAEEAVTAAVQNFMVTANQVDDAYIRATTKQTAW
jgi:hypothetical protein